MKDDKKMDKTFHWMRYFCLSATILGIGAYLMVKINDVENKINKLEKSITEKEIITKDVVGERGKDYPEKFYVLPDGRRAYLEIDGKPVENYFPQE